MCLGSSSDSSEPPPTSLVQSGPLSNIIPLFLQIFAVVVYFEVFCEGKMSKTNQNLCSLLTDSEHWIFFPAQPRRELLLNEELLLFTYAMYISSYLLPHMENPGVVGLLCFCVLRSPRAVIVFTFHCPFLHQ